MESIRQFLWRTCRSVFFGWFISLWPGQYDGFDGLLFKYDTTSKAEIHVNIIHT